MKYLLFKTLFIALVFGLAACGGEETAEQPQAEASADDGVRTIEVIGTDNLRFAVAESQDGLVTGGSVGQNVILEAIEASPGEELRIKLTTVSNLPASAMSHNLAILELGTDLDAFARASAQARDNAYIAPDMEDMVIVSTAMIGNGQSDTITFTVPEETGEYDYICSFPGHFSGGMVGKLIVSE